MRCFELGDRGIVEGFAVREEPVPCVDVTRDGNFFFPIDEGLVPLIREARKKVGSPDSVLRMKCATMMANGEALTSDAPGTDALVKINVSASPGGKVMITAANDRAEVMNERRRRVEVSFGPFPPLGASVVLPMSLPFDQQPWHVGAQELALVAVMNPGSEFRIARTKAGPGVRPVDYVKWTGFHLTLNSVRRRTTVTETNERV